MYVFLQALFTSILNPALADDWPGWLNAIPHLGWGHAMYMALGRGISGIGELPASAGTALLVSTATGTAMLVAGAYLHAVLPSQHGQTKVRADGVWRRVARCLACAALALQPVDFFPASSLTGGTAPA